MRLQVARAAPTSSVGLLPQVALHLNAAINFRVQDVAIGVEEHSEALQDVHKDLILAALGEGCVGEPGATNKAHTSTVALARTLRLPSEMGLWTDEDGVVLLLIVGTLKLTVLAAST